MLKAIAAASLFLSTAVPAQQITSYKTSNPAPLKGDADKIVCEKQETIGSRLGAKKVCMTVAEWNDRKRAQRERTEQIQAGSCLPGEQQACGSPN